MFYKTFFRVELSFFLSKSKGRSLDELRVSLKKSSKMKKTGIGKEIVEVLQQAADGRKKTRK